MGSNKKEKLSDGEIKRLNNAFSEYTAGKLKDLSDFIVLVVGFCLATLSASKIEAGYNVAIISIILFVFLFFILKAKDDPDSSLKKLITELNDKYKNSSNKSVIKHIKSYDVWNGFSPRVVWANFPILFSVLFCIYTLLDHSANAFCFW